MGDIKGDTRSLEYGSYGLEGDIIGASEERVSTGGDTFQE